MSRLGEIEARLVDLDDRDSMGPVTVADLRYLLNVARAAEAVNTKATDTEGLRAALIRHRDLIHEEREHSGLADKCKWHVCEIANRALAATLDRKPDHDVPEDERLTAMVDSDEYYRPRSLERSK